MNRGGVKKSGKRRKYEQDVQGSSEVVKYFQYDDFYNTCVDIRDDMYELLKKRLKRCKPGNPERPINLQEVREYAKNTFHKHVHKFNNELGIEFNEIEGLKTRHREELDRLIKDHRGESVRLRKGHYNEMKNCKLEQATSEKYIKELEQKYRLQEDALRQSQEEIDRLQQEHENELKKYQHLQQQRNARLQQTLHDKGKDRERLQQENQQIRQEYQALEQLAHNLNQQIQESNAEIHRLKEEVERKNGNIHQLQRQLNEEREKKESGRTQKDEALASDKAGDGLPNNNLCIPSLCDPNRPVKIAQKFAELFDNDWADAMKLLKNHGLEEKECIDILLHFVTDAYDECGRKVTELDSFLRQAVILSSDIQADEFADTCQELPADITKPIKVLRRKLTDRNIEVLQKILPQHLKEKRNLTEDQINDCKDFIKDCIKYAWMMQIQDPPVYIEWDFPEETKIDTNILRSYTKAGEKVDYIVWPVLYLHKNGPVLNKGVVQPMSPKKQ